MVIEPKFTEYGMDFNRKREYLRSQCGKIMGINRLTAPVSEFSDVSSHTASFPATILGGVDGSQCAYPYVVCGGVHEDAIVCAFYDCLIFNFIRGLFPSTLLIMQYRRSICPNTITSKCYLYFFDAFTHVFIGKMSPIFTPPFSKRTSSIHANLIGRINKLYHADCSELKHYPNENLLPVLS